MDLKKCHINIADTTGPILITLWEDAIVKVNTNTSYNFKGLKVAIYNKYLHTTSQTAVKGLYIDIQLLEEITAAAEDLKSTQKVHKYVSGNILAADYYILRCYYILCQLLQKVHEYLSRNILAADVSKVLVCIHCRFSLTVPEDDIFWNVSRVSIPCWKPV